MKRIFEKLAFANVFAPQSVEASTEKTTGYVDASGTEEVAFLISAAALGKGKSLTVTRPTGKRTASRPSPRAIISPIPSPTISSRTRTAERPRIPVMREIPAARGTPAIPAGMTAR